MTHTAMFLFVYISNIYNRVTEGILIPFMNTILMTNNYVCSTVVTHFGSFSAYSTTVLRLLFGMHGMAKL